MLGTYVSKHVTFSIYFHVQHSYQSGSGKMKVIDNSYSRRIENNSFALYPLDHINCVHCQEKEYACGVISLSI